MTIRTCLIRAALFTGWLVGLGLSGQPSFAGVISLVGHLDPFPGNDRYSDVWGEGNIAYIGSFNGSGVALIDISNPSNPVLASQYLPASGGQFKDLRVRNGVGYFIDSIWCLFRPRFEQRSH